MRPFEKIFVINLDFKTDRLEKFRAALPPCLGAVDAWCAVHGDTVQHPAWWTAGRGAWGCYRSHLQILEHCYNERIESYLVFEDDAVFREGFEQEFPSYLRELPEDWELAYIGGQLLHEKAHPPARVNDKWCVPYNVNRTHAFAVHRRGYAKLYEHLFAVPFHQNEHIDHHLGRLHESGRLRVYCSAKWLVGQDGGPSNISGRLNSTSFWIDPESLVRGSATPRRPRTVFLECPLDVAIELQQRGWHQGYWRNDAQLDHGLCNAIDSDNVSRGLTEWYRLVEDECRSAGLKCVCLYHPSLTRDIVDQLSCAKFTHIIANTADEAEQQFRALLCEAVQGSPDPAQHVLCEGLPTPHLTPTEGLPSPIAAPITNPPTHPNPIERRAPANIPAITRPAAHQTPSETFPIHKEAPVTHRPSFRPAIPQVRPRQSVLIEFPHGLSDAIQLTAVLRHLRNKHPEWDIDISSPRGSHSAFIGLCRRSIISSAEVVQRSDYDFRYSLEWHECWSAESSWPSTKATRCLREIFHIDPDPELCCYELQPSDTARSAAAQYLESICGPPTCVCDSTQAPKFRSVIIHYEESPSDPQTSLSHDVMREVCEVIQRAGYVPVILDTDGRSPLPNNIHIHRPDNSNLLWRNSGSGDAATIAALIEASTLMIGIDSGPLHVAGATLTPTLAIWTRHHPVHCFDLADNVLHFVPRSHAQHAAGEAAVAYFEASYRAQTYDNLNIELPTAVEARLRNIASAIKD